MQGEAGFIRFWQEFSEIADQIFKNLFCSKLQQEISCSDWKVRYREVREFFELPELFGSTELSEFDRYVGEYFSQNNTLEASFRIQMGEGCLVAVVEQPTIDIEQGPIGCFREVQFLPIGKNQFDVAGWPHEVLFEEDSTGKVCRLNLCVCEAGWQTDEKIYVKR